MKNGNEYNLITLEKSRVYIGTAYDLCSMLSDEIEYYLSLTTDYHIMDNQKTKLNLLDNLKNAYEDRKQIKERFKDHQLIKYTIDDEKRTTDFKIVGKY